MTKLFDLLTFLDYIDPSTTTELATYIYGYHSREAKNAVRQLTLKLVGKGWNIDVIQTNRGNIDNLYTISKAHNKLIEQSFDNQKIIDWLAFVHKCPTPDSLAHLLLEG